MPVPPITLEQTFQVRSRPDVLFRLVADPKRRIRWDKSFQQYAYTGEEKLERGAQVKIRLATRMGGLRFPAKYSQLVAPQRFTLESEKGSWAVDRFEQSWSFKPIPGGSEVSFKQTVVPRLRIGSRYIERLAQGMFGETILGLQRQVDSQAASSMEELSKELAERARKERRQKRGRK